MKLRERTLAALAAAVTIVGLTTMTANAATRPGGSAAAGATHAAVVTGGGPLLSSGAALRGHAASGMAATVGPTSQLVFDDYAGFINSVEVVGVNQNGQWVEACFTTPQTVNYLPNWWWAGYTVVYSYTNANCGGGHPASGFVAKFVLSDSPTNPPYHCQEDVSPDRDWNPGSNWNFCAIWPSPTGVWYGYAIGHLVWWLPL
jgi:hypothetical protein